MNMYSLGRREDEVGVGRDRVDLTAVRLQLAQHRAVVDVPQLHATRPIAAHQTVATRHERQPLHPVTMRARDRLKNHRKNT